MHRFADYVVEDNGILKCVNDRKRYKYLKLGNGFQALLISQPKSVDDSGDEQIIGNGHESCGNNYDDEHRKSSAACLCVRAGTFDDPAEIPGLAHLLEHVIEMGSKEYPRENVFTEYLNNCSGYRNFHTEYEETYFQFITLHEHFEDALKIFASIFVNPLLLESSMIKEIDSVDSEFAQLIGADSTRIRLILVSAVKEGHPLSKFPWGNKDSLLNLSTQMNIDLYEALVKFWRRHYMAENMVFVLEREDDLDSLESLVTEAFCSVQSKDSTIEYSRPEPDGSPFGPNFTKLYFIKPIRSCDMLSICWWVPCTRRDFKTAPLSHLSSLLDYGGKGSLLSFLKKEGLALELKEGYFMDSFEVNEYQSIFVVNVYLTDKGLAMVGKVVNYVFTFIEMLRESGPQKEFFEEEMLIEWNNFRFDQSTHPLNETQTLASRFFHCPIKHIVTTDLTTSFDEAVIMDCLKYLQRDQANILLISHEAFQNCNSGVEKEKWTGAEYKVCDIPEEWFIARDPKDVFGDKVHFPEPNSFITTNFKLKTIENTGFYPSIIIESDTSRLWYKGDQQFKTPMASINFVFKSGMHFDTKQETAMDLFLAILMYNLVESVYPAFHAGLTYSLCFTSDGLLLLQVDGYDEKLANLAYLVLDAVFNFNVDKEKFEIAKQSVVKDYLNFFLSTNSVVKALRKSLLSNSYCSPLQKLKTMAEFNMPMLIETTNLFFESMYVECLIQGNMTSAEAESIFLRVTSMIKNPIPNQFMYPLVNELPNGEHIIRTTTFSEDALGVCSTITNHYQLGPFDIKQFCLLDLLMSAMSEPLSDTLRTQEGLAYEVSNMDIDSWGVASFEITVVFQADKFSCDFIDNRIESFLKEFTKKMKSLEASVFEKLVQSKIKIRSSTDISLAAECERNFAEIIAQSYCFDRIVRDIGYLKEITLDEFKKWSLNVLDLSTRRKLSVQIVGNGEESDRQTSNVENIRDTFDFELLTDCDKKRYIKNIEAFKRSLNQYPATIVNE